MRLRILFTICLLGSAAIAGGLRSGAQSGAIPSYTADGRLQLPSDYREWVYLSSGLDMSYTPRAAGSNGHSMFDNVFVNPEAYRSFLQTGTWPDKTMLALELRGADKNGSINKAGYFQSRNVMGVELHVKNAARGGWAFYQFNGAAPAKMVPKRASCYSCHRDHGAVDTTFVQFYPTLIPVAKGKNTFRER
ncbi:MAG TPA: cytochrome P460 family protein [Bryobacteraceae bacterium]